MSLPETGEVEVVDAAGTAELVEEVAEGAGERLLIVLDIDGTANGPMQDFLRYVAVSPVLEWIGHFTEDTKATGPARLGLKLHLPLANLHDAKVQGALQLQNNDVVLFPELWKVRTDL